MDDFLTLTHATERDVDLLLIEELKCSRDFVAWFCAFVGQRLGASIFYENSSVAHSKRRIHNRREIDITLTVRGRDKQIIFLIENKLDTGAQPFQAESYREEAAELCRSRQADIVYSILVAPSAYILSSGDFSSKFDCSITYEVISEFFDERANVLGGELGDRIRYRKELLLQAITKARRGYQAVPMAEIEAFNAKYVTLLKATGIELVPGPSMLREGRPGESKTMIFAPTALPKWSFLPQTRLVHQLREGNANINFYGWGMHFSHLAMLLAPALAGTNYRPVPTINKRAGGNSGLMIVADTPIVDNIRGFDAQREEILAGMQTTIALQSWFSANRSAIEACAAKVSELTVFERP